VIRENRGDMRLVGRLVGAETRVAINSVYGFLRIGDVIRSEIQQLGIDRFHQLDHGSFQLGLEDLLARLKPFAAVVALQAA